MQTRPAARRLAQLWRTHRGGSTWFAGYLALQAYAVAGLPTPRFPDSASYLQLSFTGSGKRLWTVPLIYRLLPTDPLRIAGQVLVAAIAWWFLAAVVARMIDDRRVRLAAWLLLLALGLVGPITEWNSTILSESLSISLTALAVAAWLDHVRSPRPRSAALALAATVLWTFARDDHVILSVLIALTAVVVAALRRRALNAVIAVTLVLLSLTGIVETGRHNATRADSLSDIVQDRILANPTWTTWFVLHGMPYDSTVAADVGRGFGTRLMLDPSFAVWAKGPGERTYIRFLFTHPKYTLWDPLAALSGERPSLEVPATADPTQPNPTSSLLSPDANYGRHRQLLPTPVEELLFEQGQIGDVVALTGLALLMAVTAYRRGRTDSRVFVPLVVLGLAVPEAYLVWLGDAAEVDRHAVVLAVTVRIGLWLAAAFCADQVVSARRPTAPRPAETLFDM